MIRKDFIMKTPEKKKKDEKDYEYKKKIRKNESNKSKYKEDSSIDSSSSSDEKPPIKINRKQIYDFKDDKVERTIKKRKIKRKYSLRKKNNNNSIFFVEKILGVKKINGITHYKCKWIGFSNKQNSYEPASSFKDPKIIQILLKDYKKSLEKKNNEKNEISDSDSNYDDDYINNNLINKKNVNEKKKIKHDNTIYHSFIKGDINKDIPLKIVTVLQNKEEPNSLFIEIEWKKRKNGIKPCNSTYTNKKIREKFPLFLLDYYENAILLNQKRERNIDETKKKYKNY